jgi:hypothetical protein
MNLQESEHAVKEMLVARLIMKISTTDINYAARENNLLEMEDSVVMMEKDTALNLMMV